MLTAASQRAAVSWCALFGVIALQIEQDVCAGMVSRDELITLFSEGSSPLLELSEIRQWCSLRGLDDAQLEVSVDRSRLEGM